LRSDHPALKAAGEKRPGKPDFEPFVTNQQIFESNMQLLAFVGVSIVVDSLKTGVFLRKHARRKNRFQDLKL
jgi:hypothetical protein